MADANKSFNEVTNFVMKVKRVRKVRQAKAFAKRTKNLCNFYGSYSKESGKPNCYSPTHFLGHALL